MAENLPVATQFAQQMLAQIKSEQDAHRRKRPLLVSWSQRMPIGLVRQLKAAAKKHGVTQTDIIIQGLRQVLPVLLDQEELQRSLELSDEKGN